MNATIYQIGGQEFENQAVLSTFRQSGSQHKQSNRPSFGRKRRNGPKQFNGIHRRRRKKITW